MHFKRIPQLLFLSIIIIGCGEKRESKTLDWMEEEGYRWAELQVDTEGTVGFVKERSSHTGIDFQNYMSEQDRQNNHHFMNGSGVAAGDIDGDGWADLYFARLNGPNKLYKNMGGMRFRDFTDSAGVALEEYYSKGAVFADLNGDRHLDLLVTANSKRNVLFINDGSGGFTRKQDSGLGPGNGSTTMALADIDSDNDLDLYITRFKERAAVDIFDRSQLATRNTIRQQGNSFEMVSPFDQHYALYVHKEHGPMRYELGVKDELYLNDGKGQFQKVTDLENRFLDEDGNPKGLYPDWGLSAKFQDLNKDGLPDLYVANDVWTPDRIWINQGDGIFKAMGKNAINRYSYASMGVDFSDIDRDGHKDIFVVEMMSPNHRDRLRRMSINSASESFFMSDLSQKPATDADKYYRHNRNSLYLNRGDNSYAEIAWYSGVEASGWSWAPKFMDVTLNGYEDILVSTGFPIDVLDIDRSRYGGAQVTPPNVDVSEPIRLELPNYAYRNNGDLTFDTVSSEWGLSEEDISQGMATADLDHDGTLDLVFNRLNQAAAVYRNTSSSPRIAVRLKGESPNTQAIGATVELLGGPVASQQKEIASGGDYLSGSDPLVVFAADEQNNNHELRLTWPDGQQSQIDSIQASRIYEIDEEAIAKQVSTPKEKETSEPRFTQVNERLSHVHSEEPFNDFDMLPLLPIRLSELGPGAAWLDLNQDGIEELLIGAGKGGKTGVYSVDNDHFNELDNGLANQPVAGDQTGIVGWQQGARTHVVIGYSNYEQESVLAPSALHYQLENGNVVKVDSLPGSLSSTGPLAAADYSGDGTIDLFLGGRFLSGQYPGNASSRLFINDGGRLIPDEQNNPVFKDLGMVTSAVFTDYNGNGRQDLLLTTEWGTIKLFENSNGKFRDITSHVGLDSYTGLWQGIATGDFNNDGYPDLVATNWGMNSFRQVKTNDKGIRMYYSDFNQNGKTDIIESYYDESVGGYVPANRLSHYESISRSAFRNDLIYANQKFASLTLDAIVKEDYQSIPYKEAGEFRHMVFLNREGKTFESHPLPARAQFSNGFHTAVADMNNDGNEDILITQNFYGVHYPVGRNDSGIAMWLKGDGEGHFQVVSPHDSGVKVGGDQRGAALGDYNRDGRIDVLVTQNSDSTYLYEGYSFKSGIRIQLFGPPNNRTGIGSSVRLVYEDSTKGPRRDILAGSGYWSQNSSIQVLGISGKPVAIEVGWFNGELQMVKVSDDKNFYRITYKSKVESEKADMPDLFMRSSFFTSFLVLCQ